MTAARKTPRVPMPPAKMVVEDGVLWAAPAWLHGMLVFARHTIKKGAGAIGTQMLAKDLGLAGATISDDEVSAASDWVVEFGATLSSESKASAYHILREVVKTRIREGRIIQRSWEKALGTPRMTAIRHELWRESTLKERSRPPVVVAAKPGA